MKRSLLTPLVLLTLLGCKNPVEDFVLGFKEPIDTGTLRLQFNLPENGKVPESLQFSVTGRDADKIVSNLNTRKYRITKEGVMVLAVDPDLTPTPQQPVDFTIVAQAEGYLKVIKTFRYTSRINRTFSVQLIKADQKGVLNTRQMALSTETPVEIVNGEEKLELQFPSGNVYRNENGDPVSGTRDLALITYAATSALGRVPGGGTVSNPQDAAGKPLGYPFKVIQVAGMVSLEMSTQNQEVIKSFQAPLQANMTLNPATLNPKTGKPMSEGDRMDIISYDTDSGVWKLEGDATVQKNTAGKPEIRFPIPHLSYWIAGWTESICPTGPSFRVNSEYKDLDIIYLASLRNARDSSLIRDYYISMNNGARLNISLLPAISDSVQLVVYDFNNYHGGDRTKELVRSAAVPLCESAIIDLPAVKFNAPKPLTIEMDNSCPGGGVIPDANLPAQLRIQFSEPGKNIWRDAGSLTRNVRTSVTYRLIIGQRYDLRGSTDGGVSWPYTSKNANVNKAYWYFELKDLGYCK